MAYLPFDHLPGGFSPNDGTIDFYSRIKTLISPEMVVLDLGAGRAGWFEDDQIAFRRDMRLLKGHVASVIAVDVDDAVLENKSADETYVMSDDQIPLEDNSVDLIVSDYVLEHIDDAKAYASEIDRILKPGGWFCARTPHKYCYVSLAASLVQNAKHSKLLAKVQPHRKEIDVFPTRYKLNTLADIHRAFAGYSSKSFIFRSDPAYYFGRKWLYKLMAVTHRSAPAFFTGNLFVFVRKP